MFLFIPPKEMRGAENLALAFPCRIFVGVK